jgi:hypothetical protein
MRRFKAWMRRWLDVPDTPHVVEHFTEHGEVIDGLRRDLDASVNQLNETTRAVVGLAHRIRYYKQHSAIIERIDKQYEREMKEKAVRA